MAFGKVGVARCLAALALLFGLNGCAVYMAANQPDKKDLEVLKVGTPRSVVVAELGAPIQTMTRNGAKVGLTGFCLGGAVTIIGSVHVPELAAGVVFYGIPPEQAARPADVKIPLQAHFANKDDWCTPAAVDAFEKAMKEAGKDVSKYNRAELMKPEYDETPLAIEADERIRTFQADSAKRAGIFHHLITLPTYHTAALSTDNLAREYFGEAGMLGYVKNVQRAEIRQGIACVKHQNMAGSDIGDDHKEYFAGEAALKAGGVHNTMNQFG